EVTDIPVDDEVGAGSVRSTTVTDRTAEKTEAAARQQAQTTPPVREASSPTPEITARPDTPLATSSGNLDEVYRDVLTGLRENQKAYGIEKKITSAEKKRRFANYDRIVREARAAGKTSQEAEAM